MTHFCVLTFVNVRSNFVGSSQLGPTSNIDTTSASLDWRSINPSNMYHKVIGNHSRHLTHYLVTLVIDHNHKHQRDDVLFRDALLPPADGVQQLLLEHLLGGRSGAGPTGRGQAGDDALWPLEAGLFLTRVQEVGGHHGYGGGSSFT